MNRTLLAATCLLLSCTSYRDDVATICDAPAKIGDTSKMRPSEKLQAMGNYCVEHVKTEEGKALLGMMAAASRGERNKLVRKAAAKVGINPCHFADTL